MITISKGLDLPIQGTPLPTIYDGATVRHVALLGEEFPGLRPTLLVKVGDAVQKGQALFFGESQTPGFKEDDKDEGAQRKAQRGNARRADEREQRFRQRCSALNGGHSN